MTDDSERTWQRLTAQYLQRVEKALKQTGHPRRGEVLEDVKAHLDTLYEELSMAERTPQRMEAIIQEMGKPAEYAEMLAPDEEVSTLSSLWRRPHVRLAAGPLLVAVAATTVVLWPLQALPVLGLVLHAFVLVAVAVGYVRTRNGGFAWLGVAVVIWPLVCALLMHTVIRPAIDQVSMGKSTGIFPFTLVERGRMSLGSLFAILNHLARTGQYALILVAVVKLAALRGQPRERQRPT